VSKVQTPQQAVQSLPQVSQLPVAPTLQADNSVLFPKDDVVPLFQQLEAGAQCKVQLSATTADLADEKSIVAKQVDTIADQTKQIALKQDEITAIKHPKGFWKRFGHDLKLVAITAGTVALLLK
jgi:hypothetical protein